MYDSMIEILAPAGNKQNLIQAVSSGADAVYLGLKNFSARANADNFDYVQLKYSVAYAKTFGVKVYLAINTLIKDDEINNLIETIKFAYETGVDAFIVQDIFLGKVIKERMPSVTLHLSTQAGVCNVYGAEMAKKFGFSRVILARETTLDDIKAISKIIETEVFIQGALCTAFSGHCYFSSFVGGNSGNRGACKQPCRKLYAYKNNDETLKSGFVLSLSDLCLYEQIDVLKQADVKSFKIEGRMRSEEYVAISVQFYKNLVNGKFRQDLFKALKTVYNRGDYTQGLAFGQKTDFISDKIQNNKGLTVGKVGKIFKDAFLFEKYYNYEVGDCFKILRNGKEVGNAICVLENNKPILKFKGNIKFGDEVSITKDSSLSKKYLLNNLKKDIVVSVYAKSGERLKLSACGVTVESDGVLDVAKSAPATKDTIISNLKKTDIYPFTITVNDIVIDGNPFILNSVLNNLRSTLYKKIFYEKIERKLEDIANLNDFYEVDFKCENKFAIIVDKEMQAPDSVTDIIIQPRDYNKKTNLLSYYKNHSAKKWLYVPPFVTSNELQAIERYVNDFYGIYGDGYWCYEYCKSKNVKFFVGTGLNVLNSVDANFLMRNGIDNLVVSKELKASEISRFNFKPFALTRGAIEIMDLIYCPFSKNCSTCENLDDFILQDTDKRDFKVIRYKTTECRFKVFNCARLIYDVKNVNNLYDLRTLTADECQLIFLNSPDELKSKIKNYTNGNYLRGVE